MQTVIIKPVVSEKSMQASDLPKFTFMVSNFASKRDIKQAIKDKFGANVISISTSKIKGKRKRIGARRVEVKETATKKAVVTLKRGDKISIFESGTDDDKKKKKKK